jgi:flagella basal body P-ring formation protein FlgA
MFSFVAETASAADRVVLPVPAVVTERAFPAHAAGIDSMIDDPDRLVGMVARRTLLPGRPISESAVKEADLVNRGVPVQLVYDHGGLLITAVATPLQSGGAGDAIRVRNVDSGVVVVGTILADGRVQVGLR